MTSIKPLYAILSFAALACATSEAPVPEEKPGAEVQVEGTVSLDDAIAFEHEGTTVLVSVKSDGTAHLRAMGPDGKAAADAGGSVSFKADGVAEAQVVPLTLDAQLGLLTAAGPKLAAGLTEVGYTLNLAGKALSATLHVPLGGTAELVAAAKSGAELTASVEGKVGPHGGALVVVGGERFEIVADPAISGEIRVYLLDASLAVQALGDRKLTLGLVADAPEVAALAAVDGELYAKGRWSGKADPVRVTLVVEVDGKSASAVVGLGARANVAAGVKAPRVKVRVKSAFEAPDVDAKAKVKVDTPDVDAKVGAKGKASAKVDAKVKAPKVDAKASAKGGKAKAGVSIKF